jgi:hypothetical protein
MAIAHYFIKLDEILAFIWYVYLIILIVKAIVTKSILDKLKRNMIIIKCVLHLFFGYLGIILIWMLKFTLLSIGYANIIFMDLFVIFLAIIDIGILLFYSGTLLILFKEEVSYSWPLNRINKSYSSLQ